MKRIIFLYFLFFLFENSAMSQDSGTVIQFTIEGVASTALDNENLFIQKFEKKLHKKTLDFLKTKYHLEEVISSQDPIVIRKRGLNRLKGVDKIKKRETQRVQKNQLAFKIKCDISFDATAAGLLLNEEGKQAVVYLSIGVFEKGKRKEVLKSKTKNKQTFFGMETDVYLTIIDFELLYIETLKKL